MRTGIGKVIWAVMTLLAAAAAAPATDTTIELQAEAVASGDYVRLGDVARIAGDDSARLARIFLGPAPEESEILVIDREEISRCLVEAGYSQLVLRGANQVRICRAQPGEEAAAAAPSDTMTVAPLPASPAAAAKAQPSADKVASAEEAMLTAAIARLLCRQFRRDDLEGEAHLLGLDRPLPAGTAALEAREVISGRLPGRADIRLLALDKNSRSLGFVVAKVEAWASAPAIMLARALRKGETVAPADLLVAHVRLQPGVIYLPAKPEAVVGCQATRPLRPETPLAEGDVELPWAVRKGDLVAVDTIAGGFRIRGVAKALADGRPGCAIPVANPDTRKIYLARVTDVGKVEVVQEEER